ncbi:hypothetical protein V6N13_033244 [Hibiscus sabdariffa]|uniref:Ent-kaurenoic acid oxidase n=1 Tax=Hibiscus sabdariffa TaxID=183260 RepID=A0ABR2FB13_9ROSI
MEIMGSMWLAVALATLGGFAFLKWVLKSVNPWVYESQLGEMRYSLPPGDLGWPLIGNMWSFLRAFRSDDPDSFMGSFVSRFGRTGIYKSFMFGNPSVIVTLPETSRRVLNDDDAFKPGWPTSTVELIGKKSFIGIPFEEHKRLRRLTAAPVNGHEALNIYIPYIEKIVISSLDKWSKMGKIEFLTELRKLTFRIIMYIFLSTESEEARKNLVAAFQSVVTERRMQRKTNTNSTKKKDMLDSLIDVKDDKGETLDDEEIIDIMLMYLNAGHESSGHTTMWAAVFLQKHPEYLQIAKEEQERIVKKRPPTQKGLNLREIREMEYLSKVIDETLRLITFSLMVFREAKADVNISGYTIPKGWKALVWFRSIHLDPEIYPNPKAFDPDRWNDYNAKAGTFLPFGAGSRLCPGNDLAMLEISIFLHHFLLNYKLERLNPRSKIRYLPHTRPQDNCLAIIRKNKPSQT